MERRLHSLQNKLPGLPDVEHQSMSSTTEEIIISFFLQNPGEFNFVSDRLHPEVFTQEPWKRVWPHLHRSWESCKTFPHIDELGTMMRRVECSELSRDVLTQRLKGLYKADVSAFSRRQALDWIASREMVKLGENFLGSDSSKHDLMAQIKFARERLDKIEHLAGGSSQSIGKMIDLFGDEAIDNWGALVEEEYGADPLPLGLPRVDKKLKGGGVRPTLVLVVGPTGGGKTTVFHHWARSVARIGGRTLLYALDDSMGDLLERQGACMAQRPTNEDDFKNPGVIQAVMRYRRDQEFPGGSFCIVSAEPDRWTPQDYMRDITRKQMELTKIDLEMRKMGYDIPDEDLGKINLIGIDTADQIRETHPGKDTWMSQQKMFSELSFIPKRFKCPLCLMVQGGQETVGASQITLRNVGGSYGKSKPAKLVVALAQTVKQSQAPVTIDWTKQCWKENQANLWNCNPQADKDTQWERASLCLIKNTMASGEPGIGAVRNVIIPLLVHFGSSRIIEDWESHEEWMRQDSKTAREEREAWGDDAAKPRVQKEKVK